MSAPDQAQAIQQRMDALLARGRALQEEARTAEQEIAAMLPKLDTELAVATTDEHGVLTSLRFTPAAADATAQELEDAVNIAVGQASVSGIVPDVVASAVVAALAGGALPQPTQHVALNGGVRVEAFLGRPGRIRLAADLVERMTLPGLADAVVAAHTAAARESAPVPPTTEV